LDALGFPVVTLDTAGLVLTLNSSAMTLLGFLESAPAGRSWTRDFLSAPARGEWEEWLGRVAGGGAAEPAVADGPVRNASAGIVAVAWHRAALRTETGEVAAFVLSAKDGAGSGPAGVGVAGPAAARPADLPQTGDMLRDRCAFLEAVLDHLPVGVMVNTLPRGGNQYMNRAFVRMHGWPRGILSDAERFYKSLFPDPGYRRLARERLDAGSRPSDGSPPRWETLRIMSQGGEERVVATRSHHVPSPSLLVFTTQDVTDRARTDEALRRERDLFGRVAETMPMGLTLLDAEGRITFANSRAEGILGITRGEVSSRPYNAPEWRITTPDGNPFPDDQLPFRRVRETGRPVYGVRHAIEWPDGRRVQLSVNMAPLLDRDGRTEGLVALIEDITERVVTEEALQESEERYRRLVELLPDGVVVQRDGRIVFANGAALKLMGAERPEQAVGRPASDFIHPDSREAAAGRIRGLLSRKAEAPLIEERLLRLDGRSVDVDVAALEFSYDRKPAVLTVIRDISERKRAEAALRESERRFHLLLEHAPDGINIFEVDLENDRRRLVFCNDRFVEMSGHTRFQLLANADRIDELILYHPKAAERPATPSELFRSGVPHRGTCSWKRPDGRENYFEYTAVPITLDGRPHFIGIDRDITDRLHAENALRFTQFAVDRSADAAFWTGPDGRLIYVNEAACRSLGYRREELLRLSASDIDPELAGDRWNAVWREVRARGGVMFESVHRAKDGRVFPVEIQASHVAFGGREYNCSFARDISGRKALEAQIQADIREKEVLLKEVHHRVKNNLQIISSLLNLQSASVTDERSRRLFRESQSRIRSMALVHEQLYRSGSLARIAFGPYVGRLAEELVNSFGGLGRNFRLDVKVPDVSLDVSTAVSCGLILNELLTNALKHAFPEMRPRRGERAGARRRPDTVSIRLAPRKDGRWLLAVRDNGVGLPKGMDIRNTESLGMRIVTALAGQLGGTLRVKSGGGASFSLLFRMGDETGTVEEEGAG
jgi:PAS domain S-box-containing protein